MTEIDKTKPMSAASQKTTLDRDTFIDRYMAASRLADRHRTARGFQLGARERVAVSCACGEPGCEGWAMVSADYAEEYVSLYNGRRDDGR